MKYILLGKLDIENKEIRNFVFEVPELSELFYNENCVYITTHTELWAVFSREWSVIRFIEDEELKYLIRKEVEKGQ